MSGWHVYTRPGTSVLQCHFTVAGKLHRHSTHQRDRGKADEAAALLYLEAHRSARVPVPADTEVPKLSKLGAAYAEDLKAKLARGELTRGPTYHGDAEKSLKRTLQRWQRIDEVGPGWKRALEEWHAAGASWRKLQIDTVAVRQLLAWAVENGYLPVAPKLVAPRTEDAEAERDERRPMTEKERGQFLAELRKLNPRAHRIYLVLFYTGARKSDLERMTLRQINWKTGFVELPPRQTKSKKRDQVLFLHPKARAAIKAHLRSEQISDLDAPVFGKVKLKRWFLMALENRKIDPTGLVPHHGTRHTAATMVAAAGATLAELMAFGRWVTPQMAARYMKVNAAQAKKAVERL